ncbi:MAG: AI-2E family transporter [Alphaproteobacteria bacterium]|nr:AI-2E family transporter [Alphaproteobacteria bacterium]MBE8219927.1 AI-2E family transporter [Alphaproteobacteria bacterium]
MIRNNLPFMMLIGFLGLLGLMALMGGILLPFILGFAAAYLLNPLADALERIRLPRILATALISILFVGVIVAGVFYGSPIFIAQFQQLFALLSDYFGQVQAWAGMHQDFLPDPQQFFKNIQSIGNHLLYSSLSIFNLVTLILITPIVGIYLLNDWNHLVSTMNGLLPVRHAPRIRALATEVDKVLGGFVRGQIAICIFLATFYAISLYALGLQGGIAVGIVAGILSFIPYVGTALGLLLAGFLTIGQFGMMSASGASIIGVFIVGQIIEGNVLTPRIIGNRVRLHPVWILFALLLMSGLLGFLGLLLAVPAAAVIGVLVRATYHDATSQDDTK